MTVQNRNSEQIREELIQQDPSFSIHKKEYDWLIERMLSHKPQIEQDEFFQSQLRDRLRYHLITQYLPTPQINRWQKFLLYGTPTIAIGITLIFVIPIFSLVQQDDTIGIQPIMMQRSHTNSTWEEHYEWKINEITTDSIWDMHYDTTTSMESTYRDYRPESISHSNESYDMMVSEWYEWTVIIDDTTLDQSQLFMTEPASAIEPMMMKIQEPLYHQSLRINNLTTDYTISYDENGNLWLDALITIEWCDTSYTLHNPLSLSRWPNLWHVEALPQYSIDSKSYSLTLTVQDNTITAIDWYEYLCQ